MRSGRIDNLVVKSDTMKVAIPLQPETVASSVANVLDVLHSANRYAGKVQFETCLLAATRKPVGAHGVALKPQAGLEAMADCDLVLVPAARGPVAVVLEGSAPLRQLLPDWLRPGRQLASVCAGAQVLAGTGLLDGRRATTFWGDAREVREAFPAVLWRFEHMVERDGAIMTSGGGSAGIDLALAVVEQVAGLELAQRVAAAMLFDHRRGPQSNYFPLLPGSSTHDPLVAAAQQRLRAAFADPPDVPTLAAALHTSPRNLLRRFKAETGLTLQAYGMRLRLEAARVLLEDQATIDQAVAAVGYVDRASFSRAFKAHYGVPPMALRARRQPVQTVPM